MPLTNFEYTQALRFAMSKAVDDLGDGWVDVQQGDNSLTATYQGIDLAVWDLVYAKRVTLFAGGTDPGELTIDLKDFATLAGEQHAAMTAVHSMWVFVAPATEGGENAVVTVQPGDTDGLEWFYGSGLNLNPGEQIAKAGSMDFQGVLVIAGQHTIKITTSPEDPSEGADAVDVTVVILGSSTI